MNKTLTISRNDKQQKIIVRQMAHDTQYAVGSKIKYGSGKMWTVTTVQCAHNWMWIDGEQRCGDCNVLLPPCCNGIGFHSSDCSEVR